MKPLAAALGTLLLITACAHGPTTTTTTTTTAPNASAPAAPVATTAPGGGAPAQRTASAAPAASHSAGQAGTPPVATARVHAAKPVARTAPNVAPARVTPQILGASVSPAVVGSGTTVSATVRTTPGVVSVVAYAGGASMAVPRVGPGLFEGSTTLPPLPPFAHGSYAVTFVARDAHGASTQSAVGVTVR